MDDALGRLETEEFDVVVTDLRLGTRTGLELAERVSRDRPDVPVILVTAFGSLDTAIGAIRAGACDFLQKPFDLEELAFRVRRAASHASLEVEVRRLRERVGETPTWDEIAGESSAMKRLFAMLDRVAESDATVLVTGESGTGKELVARAIHRRGPRAGGPFVAVNCAAVPEPLLESELFGHVRGAFTDARTTRKGLFARAAKGTIFLDEIGELPLGLQPKLLRVLQERRVRPVGADEETPIDVRVVAATNKDLESAIEEGRFREDLFYRIEVLRAELPPLRARGADVLLLAQRFLDPLAERAGTAIVGISAEAAERLLAYPWPGNVRELHNAMEHAVALARRDRIAVEDLPPKVSDHRRSHVVVAANDPSELVTMEEVERRYVLRVMEAAGGNKTMAARVLGFDRTTLYRKLERYG
jgi:two-component system response regulator HydG